MFAQTSWLNLFLHSFALFGVYLGILTVIGQLVLPTRRFLNYLLALLYILLSLHNLSILCFVNDEGFDFRFITYLHLTTLCLLGPTLYSIHKIIQNPEWEANASQNIKKHSIVPLFAILLTICLYAVPFDTAWIAVEKYRKDYSIIDLIHIVPIGILLGYVLALTSHSKVLFQKNVLKEEWTARVLLYIIAATFVNHSVALLYFPTRNPIFLSVSASLITVSLCVTYLIGRRFPAYFQNLQAMAAKTQKRYARSLVPAEEIPTLTENVVALMTKDKIYREEDLTLSSFADELAISPHQLSELINNHLGKNFAAFVNEFRIREACELLRTEPERSILDIAFSVGFNSKTSFQRVFVKSTGLSPSQYRQSGEKHESVK